MLYNLQYLKESLNKEILLALIKKKAFYVLTSALQHFNPKDLDDEVAVAFIKEGWGMQLMKSKDFKNEFGIPVVYALSDEDLIQQTQSSYAYRFTTEAQKLINKIAGIDNYNTPYTGNDLNLDP